MFSSRKVGFSNPTFSNSGISETIDASNILSDTSIRPYGNHTGNSAPSVEADNSHEGYGYSDEVVRQHRQGQP